jgi:hypothetical protein
MRRFMKFAGVVSFCAALGLLFAASAPTLADGQGQHGAAQHGASMAHGHGAPLMVSPGPEAPAITMEVKKDPVGGWNLHLRVKNFRFAPERASAAHRAGEGHAHLYVNGKKIARLYSPWFHIGSLPGGTAVLRVTLNTNDHREIMVGGKAVQATRTVDGSPAKK